MAKDVTKAAADTTARKVRGKPFKAGAEWKGNKAGRPKGSRHKVSEDFISALCAEFEQNGADAIAQVREESPATFLKLVADLVPREFELKHDAGDAFLALWEGMSGGKPEGE